MGLPIIPRKTQHEAITDILESIALEETSIAHLLNAEGEKLQAVACMMHTGKLSPDEVIKIQETVAKVIQTVIKMQILLEFKLDAALDSKKHIEKDYCEL